MAQNKVMKLWTTVVTALLALCTALGLITTAAAAAVPQTETARNCAAPATKPSPPLQSDPHDRSLPPTMKQRIRAEAHGSSPSCRHRGTAADLALASASPVATDTPLTPAEPDLPLQR